MEKKIDVAHRRHTGHSRTYCSAASPTTAARGRRITGCPMADQLIQTITMRGASLHSVGCTGHYENTAWWNCSRYGTRILHLQLKRRKGGTGAAGQVDDRCLPYMDSTDERDWLKPNQSETTARKTLPQQQASSTMAGWWASLAMLAAIVVSGMCSRRHPQSKS